MNTQTKSIQAVTKPTRLNTAPGSTFIGRRYPLYLDNSFRHYYLVEIMSPNLSNNLLPNLSLRPVITRMPDIFLDMKSAGILYMSKQKADEVGKVFTPVEKVKSLLYSSKYRYSISSQAENEFPSVEMKYGDSIQRTLIVQLRDQLRWRNYRFWKDEKYVDILWSENQMLVARVVDDGETTTVYPHELYYMEDVEFKNPITNVDVSKLFDPITYRGKSRISELNREIKDIEYASFSKEELK